MKIKRVKVGYQQQAKKSIYLLATGVIQCGNFEYAGRYKKKLKSLFTKICDLVPYVQSTDECDVSEYRYWDAVSIYDDYVVGQWLKSVSAEQMAKLSRETQVKKMLEDIQVEFVRAVGAKWRRIFKKADPNSPEMPKQPWQIL